MTNLSTEQQAGSAGGIGNVLGTERGIQAPVPARPSSLRLGERLVGPAFGVAALVVLFYFLTSGTYLSTILEDVLIFAIAAMALDFFGGYGGLITLGQAAFVGIGAYGVAIGEAHGYSPWVSVGFALGAVLVAALATGVVAVRVSGITFVIVTLAIGQIFWGLTYEWTALTSGDNGIPLLSVPYLGPFDLADTKTLEIVTFVVFLIVMALLMIFIRSPFGLTLRGIKSNEPRLRALGYRTGYQRYVGYVISSFLAGIAGVLYIFSNQLISPSTLTFLQDGFITLMAIMGGLASIWGAAIGALIVVMFQQEVSIYLSRWETLLGIVFIFAVIFTPDGFAGLVRKGQWIVHHAFATRGRNQRGSPPSGSPDEAVATAGAAGPVAPAAAEPIPGGGRQ